MGFVVQGIFSVGFDDKIGHNIGFKLISISIFPTFCCTTSVPRCAAPHKNFQKKKKEKKESHSSKWKVSKKQVFL